MENSHLTCESNPSGESTQRPAAADLEMGVGGKEMDDNSTPRQSSKEVDEPESNPIRSPEKHSLALRTALCLAVIKGDWKIAKSIFDSDSSAVTMKITAGETVLHLAAIANHISFVEKLVQLTSSSDLAAKNERGHTALSHVAISGVVRIAKVMVDKNPDLPNLHDPNTPTPVLMAVAFKRKDMASFLFSKTNFKLLTILEQFQLLMTTIYIEFYDIALDILKKKPELAKERMENGYTALHALARKPFAIGSSNELSFWKRYINSRFKGIYNKALMQTLAHQLVEHLWNFVLKLPEGELLKIIRDPGSSLLHDAASVGNVEFLIILIRSYPQFLWERDEDNKTIFHTAVENRQESVFSLVYEIEWIKDYLFTRSDSEKRYNILHLAGKLAAPYHLNKVSGAALQMQRELLWFKEVEKNAMPYFSNLKVQVDGLTPRELFTKEHKQLLKDGEEWMKNTANSCMLVATLIATVVFAAAFTVPGGNDDKEGIPIFRQNYAFTVFVISDVAALALSTTSMFSFLSILTTRYAEDDFLVSLPTKLMVGLVTLFVSIVCMVVAFSATFFIAYHKTKAKIPLAIAAVAIVPVGFFCVFHWKLVVDLLHSTYWSRFSLRRRKQRLF